MGGGRAGIGGRMHLNRGTDADLPSSFCAGGDGRARDRSCLLQRRSHTPRRSASLSLAPASSATRCGQRRGCARRTGLSWRRSARSRSRRSPAAAEGPTFAANGRAPRPPLPPPQVAWPPQRPVSSGRRPQIPPPRPHAKPRPHPATAANTRMASSALPGRGTSSAISGAQRKCVVS